MKKIGSEERASLKNLSARLLAHELCGVYQEIPIKDMKPWHVKLINSLGRYEAEGKYTYSAENNKRMPLHARIVFSLPKEQNDDDNFDFFLHEIHIASKPNQFGEMDFPYEGNDGHISMPRYQVSPAGTKTYP